MQQLPVPEPAHPTPLTSGAPQRSGKGRGLTAAALATLFTKKPAAKLAPSKPPPALPPAASDAARLEFRPLSSTADKALQRSSAQPALLTAEPSSAGKSSRGASGRPTWEHPSEEGILQLIAGARPGGWPAAAMARGACCNARCSACSLADRGSMPEGAGRHHQRCSEPLPCPADQRLSTPPEERQEWRSAVPSFSRQLSLKSAGQVRAGSSPARPHGPAAMRCTTPPRPPAPRRSPRP